ncbi:large subunit ribosomal protein L5e [Nematocida sp. AWRm77]|nr:large subunit ribosomal protein L5e [Nematocida sp. AWRm77]
MSETVSRETKSRMKRLRLPFRRRREGRTDYRQRQNMIRHNKSNYGEVKSRFVVRITNQKVICQIVQAYKVGDKVVCTAESTELKKYGITFGLKNYSAAYATGFLCARKMLCKLGLSETFKGKEELDGEEYLEEKNEEGPQPYTCFLDLGLSRSTKGAKVFSAMKGACDGGLYIPHSPSKFVGYGEEEADELNAETLRGHIFGQHVAAYMKMMEESNPEKYKQHFSQYISAGVSADTIEGKYTEMFEAIRNETFEKTERKSVDRSQYKAKNATRLTAEERRFRAQSKYNALVGATTE